MIDTIIAFVSTHTLTFAPLLQFLHQLGLPHVCAAGMASAVAFIVHTALTSPA